MIKMVNTKKNRKLTAYIINGTLCIRLIAHDVTIKDKNISTMFGGDVEETITCKDFKIIPIKDKRRIKQLMKSNGFTINMININKNRKIIVYITDGKICIKIIAHNATIKDKNISAIIGGDIRETITCSNFKITQIKDKRRIKRMMESNALF